MNEPRTSIVHVPAMLIHDPQHTEPVKLELHQAEERRDVIRTALRTWRSSPSKARPFSPAALINDRLRAEGYSAMSEFEHRAAEADAMGVNRIAF